MKFLVDLPLSPEFSEWLISQGHDALHAFTVGLGTASDAAIIEHAGREGRVVITADLDYPRILALARAHGPGLVIFRGGNYTLKELVDRFNRAVESVPVTEWEDSIIVIDKKRIRRRRLPI